MAMDCCWSSRCGGFRCGLKAVRAHTREGAIAIVIEAADSCLEADLLMLAGNVLIWLVDLFVVTNYYSGAFGD
jgi:hypothetical protein